MYAVVDACKEMAKVMRKCFLQCNACFFGVFFHFRPDVAAVYRVSVFCDEDCAASDAFLFAVVEQFHFQFVYEIDLAVCSCAKFLTQILIFFDTNFSAFSGSILRKLICIFCVKINKNLYIKQHIFYNYFR